MFITKWIKYIKTHCDQIAPYFKKANLKLNALSWYFILMRLARGDICFKRGVPHLVKYPTDSWNKRGRTTYGEIGPVAVQMYEIWNRTIFVRGKSKLCIYTKHSFLTINLLE